MKTIIQHAETRLYLGRGGKWIEDPQNALAFLDEIRARDFCIYRRLAKATVVALPEGQPKEDQTVQAAAPLSIDPKHEIENMKPKAVTNKKNLKTQSGPATPPKPITKAVEPTPSVFNPQPKAVAMSAKEPIPTPKSPSSLPVAAVSAPAVTTPAIVPKPKPVVTTIAAKIDIGYGNVLFIRGQGDGLSWDKGAALQCVDASTWVWSTKQAQGKVIFKLLVNDQLWSQGADLVVEAGTTAEVVPVF
jgi:hypothetical protein